MEQIGALHLSSHFTQSPVIKRSWWKRWQCLSKVFKFRGTHCITGNIMSTNSLKINWPLNFIFLTYILEVKLKSELLIFCKKGKKIIVDFSSESYGWSKWVTSHISKIEAFDIMMLSWNRSHRAFTHMISLLRLLLKSRHFGDTWCHTLVIATSNTCTNTYTLYMYKYLHVHVQKLKNIFAWVYSWGACRINGISAIFAISRNMCPKFQNYMEPHGGEKIKTRFLMLKNWILVVNFSRNIF